MKRKILGGIAAVVIVFLIVVATRPPTFHVERSRAIEVEPRVAFGLVNDFHEWRAWSPWEKLDPQMKTTYTGPSSGQGAQYSWIGNSDVGEGRMTILKSEPSRIEIKIEFLKPMAATNIATFTFEPEKAGTKVTWAMDGNNNFAAKAFQLFMNMDKMVGGDFEKGLNAMKLVAETAAKTPTAK